MFDTKNYSGPASTASSALEGRLKVGVTRGRKKKILKKVVKNKI